MPANVEISDTFDQWRTRNNELFIMTQSVGSAEFIKLTNTTDSTSNTTGSIITAGGVGIAKDATIGGSLNVHGDIHANGAISADGSITLGDADTDNIVLNADINSNIIPNSNVTYHIGNSTQYWANGYFEAINISQASDSGVKALVIDADDEDIQVVTIDAEQTTVNVFQIDADALTTGTLMYLASNSTSISTRNLLEVVNDRPGAVGTTVLALQADAGRGLFIDSNLAAGGYAIEVDSDRRSSICSRFTF